MIEVKHFQSERTGEVFPTKAAAVKDENKLSKAKIAELKTRIKAGKPWIPAVGDVIYVRTSLYIDHGEDDVEGGLALVTVSKPEPTHKHPNGGVYHLIETAQHPRNGYYWNTLQGDQKELMKRFKDRVAYPDPELSNGGYL
jgi:hypothetical protein